MTGTKVTKKQTNAKLEVNIGPREEFDTVGVLQELGLELHSFATQAGLLIIEELMRLESEYLAGARYQRQTEIDRWGRQRGYIRLGGQKIGLERPRLRDRRSGKEVALQTYGLFQKPDHSTEQIYERLIGGLSGRRYEQTVEQVLEGYGVSRSAVSRHMVIATAARVKQLVERDLSGFDVRVLLIDAVGIGATVQTVVLGIDGTGSKQVLGMREGATENAAVVNDLLADLIERGLPNEPERGLLVVIDGSKALAKAVGQTFGKRAQIQRCQVHKLRNIDGYLPKHLQATYRRKISAAYAMTAYTDAVVALRSVVTELEKINVSAAASLNEGLEETLTVHRLGLPETLRRSLRSTNIIESLFSTARHTMKNVRRWRSSQQAQRWTAAVLLEAEKKFRRIRGHNKMPVLIEAITNCVAQ